MRPPPLAAIWLLLAGCASTPDPNIVVSNVGTEAAGLPIATTYCAQFDRTAIFNSKLGESYQFDCVKRRP